MRPRQPDMLMASPWGHTVVKAFRRRNAAHVRFHDGLLAHHGSYNRYENLSPAKVMARWRAFVEASNAYEAVKREGNQARARAFAMK